MHVRIEVRGQLGARFEVLFPDLKECQQRLALGVRPVCWGTVVCGLPPTNGPKAAVI
jgi:hypothetical protein